MSHSDTVRELVSLLKPHNEARPTVLLGAGASFSSGVPLADESVRRIARRYYAERVVAGQVLPEQVKTSEWMAWLGDQPWFIRDPARLSENFPLAVKHLLRPQAYRQRLLLDLIAPNAEIGNGYRHLAELVLRGLVGTILTTNFDICLPRVLNDKRPHIRHVAEVNRGPDDFREFDIFNRAQIVWLHGKAEQYTDRNLSEEVAQLDPKQRDRAPWAGADGPLANRPAKPLIAAVEGYAVAGGLGVALWADMRIASETAVFGVFCRRFGVPMSDGTPTRLPRVVGEGRALDMLLTGRPVKAEEALAMGLANRVVPAGKALETALAIARQIAGFPPLAMLADRQAAIEAFDQAEPIALVNEAEGAAAAKAAEAQAGAARFASGAGRHGDFGKDKS